MIFLKNWSDGQKPQLKKKYNKFICKSFVMYIDRVKEPDT